MISQIEADRLINVIKRIQNKNKLISFPNPCEYLLLEAESDDLNKDKFIFDINRKGQYSLKKCTYQSRYRKSIILLRIDIEGPEHDNPDGSVIECPHIHIYREGFGTSWAYPLPQEIKTDTSNLLQVLIDFLEYNNVNNINSYSYQEGGFI